MGRNLVFAAVGTLALAGVAAAQQQQNLCSYTDSYGVVQKFDCSTATPDSKPKQDPNAVPANKKFPYPGDPEAPKNSAAPTPATPDSNATPAKKFPFPGEDTAQAPPAAPNAQQPAGAGQPSSPESQGLKDEGSSGSSSSSSSSSDSDASSSSSSLKDLPPSPDDDTDADDAARTAARNARRKQVPVVKEKEGEAREQEDLQVAGFYQNDGNYRGAYMRSQDAVSIDDADPAAHMALANAARKLGKLDEAMKHYKRVLELDPLPKDKKLAQQALKEMAGG